MAMSIIETVALHIGPAIAKSILKQWLKDSHLAADSSASIIDLLKTKTSDVLAQRKAQRQFEAIGERVAESLLLVFEADGARISPNGQKAVALAVAETLNKSNIDARLLSELSLEPPAFASHLMNGNPNAARFFDASERALYERIIQESSQYIVDIASQLPNFTERTFAEVLRRQNQLEDIAIRILDEVRRIRAQSNQADEESSRFEVEYRRAVIRNLDELQLFGVDLSTSNRRHRLSVAYVTLSVKYVSETDIHLSNREKEKYSSELEELVDDDIPTAVPVNQMLESCDRLIVLGEAGSGKTTLLQWIAVHSAQNDFPPGLEPWNNTIPFFIRLRQCSETGLPAPEEFPRFIASSIAGTMPSGWVHEQLNTGRAIVLIDGVDEMGQMMRKEVRSWLRDLVGTYEQSRFILSSRPYALENDSFSEFGFVDAELMPMEVGDIMAFIDHWHSAVREELPEGEEKDELLALAENLKTVIQGTSHIRKLSTNPLLCAMICALHRDRQRRLPSDRIELYEACFRMLADRRDIERGVDLRDYPNLSYRQKRALLQDLAYWLLKNGYSMADQQQIEDRITTKLSIMEGVDKHITGSTVCRMFVHRSGILREPINAKIDFSHRTFQEFLGAQAALDDNDLGFLVNNANDEGWREVVILAAGLARTIERGILIKQLIERGDRDRKDRHQLHLLAVACLETSVELEPNIRTEVQRRLRKLVPPKNLTEAKALASAGDLALPFLTFDKAKTYYSNIAAACVRTLILIGSDSSLYTLKAYVADDRLAVQAELTRGWEYFDRSDYARQIFSGRSQLRFKRASSLDGVETLDGLKTLIVDEGYCENLKPLTELVNLSALYLYDLQRLIDLSPLRALNLEVLVVWYCSGIRDIEPLTNLPFLRELRLIALSKVDDFAPLADLKTLRVLHLQRCHLQDLRPMAQLENLEILDLSYCRKIEDLSPLIALPKLKRLRLQGLQDRSIPEELKSKVIFR
jgi:hypothetical protein